MNLGKTLTQQPPTVEALILAGGLGTRLYPLTQDTPKPMVPVADRPFLSYLLDELSRQSVTRAVLSIGHLGQQIRDHFGTRYGTVELAYADEPLPLGTGGAIVNSLAQLHGDDFLVLNGDTFMQLEYADLLRFHRSTGADISLCLKSMRDFDRYGNVVLSGDRVQAFEEKRAMRSGLINAGVYAINRRVFEQFPMTEKFSFETDLLTRHLTQARIHGLPSDGYFIDIGVPDDYRRAQTELPKVLHATP